MTKLEADLKSLRDRWALLGVVVDAYADNTGTIRLPLLVVKKTQRKQGLGTLAMKDLIKLADRHRVQISLSPSVDFGASSVARLKKFYSRFGFFENKGRRKDFTISDTMYRPTP